MKKIILKIIKTLGLFFYDKKYLEGRYFKNSNIGYIWLLKGLFYQKILGFNKKIPWPIVPFFKISNFKNVVFDPDDINLFQSPGCYYQCSYAKIYIGRNTQIAPNVGIITSNHSINDLNSRDKIKNVVISRNCWIGMNSVILPGVKLGPHTIVAAGAIVTKSFKQGNIVIGGNPAKIIKYLDKGNV